MRFSCLLGVAAVVCACGGNISGGSDGGSEGGTPPSKETRTFAIRSIFLGETDRNGTPSNTAWKDFGYNLDGLQTTKDSTDVCTLASGALKLEQIDGTNGIDNAWGSGILSIVETADSLPTPSKTATSSIQSGATTLEIQILGLSGDPSQTSSGLKAQVFVGGVYPGTPTFDSTTDWPVLMSSLADSQTIVSGSKTTYLNASVTIGTFISGPTTGVLTLTVALGGSVTLPLFIHHSFITIDPAGNGTIAGVLDANEFNATFRTVAAQMSPSLCGTGYDGIAYQVLQTQEILSDGTNSAGKPCDALSIGIGFTAARIANPTQIEADPPPPPSPCP